MTSPIMSGPAHAKRTQNGPPEGSGPVFAGEFRESRDWPFLAGLGLLGGCYVVLILMLLLADVLYTSPQHLWQALRQPEIQAAVALTLKTCTLAAILSLWVGVPLAYLLTRFRFRGRGIVDTLVDVPIVLPPLVLGLSLLILFHLPVNGTDLETWLRGRMGIAITHHVGAVVLAQFVIATAFVIRTMRVVFAQMNPRAEDVARTLGCSRGQAFVRVCLPQALPGILAAFTVAWARALGEFGPILVFAGATRMRTEVLSTTVFLEMSVGNLEAAVGVSLFMVTIAIIVLLVLRLLGDRLRI
ncbi:ABC transporter permease [Planctomicrobium sp. SH664]|uniref:ABC transporter permease n=1 Tax=Planctomicrobium sp. SH664 TaxID=3448125 RepID=UPI003F5B5DEF